MGTHRFNRHTIWTVFFSLLIALGLGACSDVSNAPAPVTPPSPDAKLSSLDINPGSLLPAFSSDTLGYVVDVNFNVASVTVTAAPQNATATMTINGTLTNAGQATPVTLQPAGFNTIITIVVTAANGGQNSYVVTVNRALNNSLQNLTVSPGTLSPGFTASTTSYTMNVGSGDNSVTVTATLQDTNASMTINGLPATSGQARTITPLNGPGLGTLVTVVVTAPNGSQKIYFVTVNRDALGGNNNLQNLTVTSSPAANALTPAFVAPGVSGSPGYTVAVASSVTSVTVTATLQDTNASMLINGQPTTSGQARTITPLNGPGLGTLVTIEVTAPNGSPKTYILTVNRDAVVLSGNNDLSGLVVSAGSLSPSFGSVPGNNNYTVTALTGTTSTTVTATLAVLSAALKINGSPAISGQPSSSIALVPGPNPAITILVTAEDGTPKTYMVTITVTP